MNSLLRRSYGRSWYEIFAEVSKFLTLEAAELEDVILKMEPVKRDAVLRAKNAFFALAAEGTDFRDKVDYDVWQHQMRVERLNWFRLLNTDDLRIFFKYIDPWMPIFAENT